MHLFGKKYTGGRGTKYKGEWNDVTQNGASYASSFYSLDNFGYICEWDEISTVHDHNWVKGKETQPTCIREGSQEYICSVCQEVKYEQIARLKATIKLSRTSVVLKKGESFTVKVSNLANGDSIKSWETSNQKIASVNSKGKITARKKGTAAISVTLRSGKKAVIKVRVK